MKVRGTLWRVAATGLFGLFGIVAAFATISPSPQGDQPPPSALITEPVAIHIDEARLPAPASYVREERFQRGDTVAGVLARLGIDATASQRLLRANVLSGLRPGYAISAVVGADGELQKLSFLTARDSLVEITPDGSAFQVADERAHFETRAAMKSSIVRSSLFAATDAAGIPDSVAGQLADIFGGDIDFHRDLRKGDRFSVVYEVRQFAGRSVGAGRVLAAEFVNQGKVYRAVRFGQGYYAPDGKNLRKAFLRSPLEFSRVSSGFGMRMHPFMQNWRAHKGIDYAAPIGTRVRAVADAVVEYAGPRGGYGNVVMLRHNGQYATVYAHLSRIAVRRGARVAQNDTIGFVGQTGWATGPHLHYEFRVAGQARNPLALSLPAASPIAPQELAAFHGHVDALTASLDLLANSNLALLD
jgi:murein DD-endopeptidase MepM/ murein hydrolase activator NlpD